MGVLIYVAVGLVVGTLAGRMQHGPDQAPQGLLGTTLLGVVGAVTAGWGWSLLIEQQGAGVFAWSSILVSAIGAGVTLSVLKLIRS